MAEALQTRTEHSRSLEDAEEYRAIQTLKEVGLLVPLEELETFHGRLGRTDDAEWAVDPAFANGSNDSGNNNVNNRPTLYTGERQIVREFAAERGNEVVRSAYFKTFEEKVHNYTPEERQEWLDRENKRRETLPYAQRTAYTLDDLQGRVFSEARNLERRAPQEKKEALGVVLPRITH